MAAMRCGCGSGWRVLRAALAGLAASAAALAFLSAADAAPGGITLVKTLGRGVVGNTGASVSLVVPAGGVAAGDTVILEAFVSSTNIHVASVADARGNVYSVDDEIHSARQNAFVISAPIDQPLLAGDRITVTFDHNFFSVRMVEGAEFSGVAAVDRVVYAGHSSNWTGAGMYSTGVAPPARAGDLLVGTFSVNLFESVFATGSGFADLDTVRGSFSGTAVSLLSEFKVAGPADAARADATKSPSSGNWTGQVVEYRTAASLGPQPLAVAKTGAGTGSVAGGPISCGATCRGVAAPGSDVTLVAVADAGSVFAGWGGDCAGTGPCTLRMDRPHDVTATFDSVGPPGIAFVKRLGDVADAGTSSSASLTVPAGGVAAGDTVVLSAFDSGADHRVVGVSDTRGNVYTVDDESHNVAMRQNAFVVSGAIANPLRAGDSITVTFDGASYGVRLLTGAEFSGIAATDRVARIARSGNWIGSTIGASTATGVGVDPGALLVGVFSVARSGVTFTAGPASLATGDAQRDLSGSAFAIAMEYRFAEGGVPARVEATKDPRDGQWTANLVAYRSAAAPPAAAPPRQLTVTKPGTGSGSVTGGAGLVNCGRWCSATFDVDANVTLTAKPDDGSVFTGWTGDCSGTGDCTLAFDRSHDVGAVFTRRFGLSVVRSGSGSGSVSGGPIDCGSACTADVDAGAVVTLSAHADDGSVFVGWSGDCSGTGDCSLTFDGSHSVGAVFARRFGLSVVRSGSGSGSVSGGPIDCGSACAADVDAGAVVTLSAHADDGSVFVGWSGDCSGTGDCTLTFDAAHTVTAQFDPASGPVDVGPGFVSATTRAPVRTADGSVYLFVADDTASILKTGPGVVHAYKGNRPDRPTSFAEVDAAHHPRAGGSANTAIPGVDARLGPNGVVSVLYVDDSFPTWLVYQTFSTVTDTWGPAETIADHVGSQDRGRVKFALTLDDAGNPHVVYCVGTSVLYTNRVGGSWTSPVTVATGVAPLHPMLEFSPSGALDVAWLDDGPPPKIQFAFRPPGDTAFTGPETVDDQNVLSNSNADQGPSLAITASRQPTVLYLGVVPGHPPGLSLPMSVVRVRTRTASGWVENGPGDVYTHTPQIYVRDDDRYVFLGHDIDVNFGYLVQVAGHGWSSERKLDTAQHDGSASIRAGAPWDVIDASYFDEDRLRDHRFLAETYYVRVPPDDGADTAPLDTTPPQVQLNAPVPLSTVSGTVSVTASASDDVGVAGVQFTLDGQPLGSERTSAPYSVDWDTSNATPGTHVLGATARDAAGNTRDAAAIVVTVAAPPPPPPTPDEQALLGAMQLGSSSDYNDPGLAEAYSVDATTSGALARVSVYLESTSTAPRIVVGVYADANGSPGARIARGALAAPVAGEWNAVALDATVHVTSGTTYWIALLSPTGSGTVRFRDRCCGGGPAETSAESTLADLPSVWTTGHRYQDGRLSAVGLGIPG